MNLVMHRRHLHQEVDRWGNIRIYFRVGRGMRVRIRLTPGSEEFDKRYHELLRQHQAGELKPGLRDRVKTHTFRWLCQRYLASPEFKALDSRTQHVRRQIIDHMCAEPISPGAALTFRDCPLERFTLKAVKIIRNRKATYPEAANARVKIIRSIYRWALENDIEGATVNPARDVTFLKPKRVGGFAPWAQEDILRFEQRHPVGTKPRLALDLLRYTGVRRSDVILIGRQHLIGAVLSFVTFKGRNRTPVRVDMEIGPALQASLDAGPRGDMVFLVTEQGKPYTHGGFGNWFRRQCALAGITDRSPHGLRKAAAVAAAEEGLTEHELMARFGWLDAKLAAHYTRSFNRTRVGIAASRRINRSEGEQISLTSDGTNLPVRENGSKKEG